MKNMQVRRWETWKHKPQAGVVILTSENLKFWISNMMKDKEEYSIAVKGSIIQEL